MDSIVNTIQFHYADIQFSFPKRTESKKLIAKLIEIEGHEINHINYIFCTDGYLLNLNQDYLQHDTLTDIITFHYHSKAEPILSDIYISIDRVRENASIFRTTFKRELHRVLFHGALHLCGYKDKSDSESALMRQKEDEYLNLFHI